MVRHVANDQVWEHIMGILNARTGKAFTKTQVIRKFKAIQLSYRIAMGVPRYAH